MKQHGKGEGMLPADVKQPRDSGALPPSLPVPREGMWPKPSERGGGRKDVSVG